MNSKSMKRFLLYFLLVAATASAFLFIAPRIHAATVPTIVMPSINIQGKATNYKAMSQGLQVLIMFAFLAMAPYILMMTTSFIRVIIVLSFIRTAIGTQQVPPTQVLMGLALFLTFYIMSPVGKQLNDQVIVPFNKGTISVFDALHRAPQPVKTFMINQVQKQDLALFFDLAKLPRPTTREDIPMYVLMPAFMVSEIKIGFQIGFLIYIPFLIIDMVVASVLMSMGMFMLSPMTISLPFKLLLFVMVDGWELIIKGLVQSFH